MRIVLLVVLLSGCMGLPFSPETEQGAQCKVECGFQANGCIGSLAVCDNAHRRCINGCRDVDRMALEREK